jgi:hypothetical protein
MQYSAKKKKNSAKSENNTKNLGHHLPILSRLVVGWLIITIENNKTIEIVFLKNESREQ